MPQLRNSQPHKEPQCRATGQAGRLPSSYIRRTILSMSVSDPDLPISNLSVPKSLFRYAIYPATWLFVPLPNSTHISIYIGTENTVPTCVFVWQ